MKKVKIIISWLAVVIIMCVVFVFSSQPAVESNETSGGFIEFLYNIYAKIFGLPAAAVSSARIAELQFLFRKGAHFSIYLILGLFFCNAYFQSGIVKHLPLGVLSAVSSFLYSASDEFHQTFVPGRSGELSDVLIDSTGAIIGVLIYLLILRCKKWILRKR